MIRHGHKCKQKKCSTRSFFARTRKCHWSSNNEFLCRSKVMVYLTLTLVAFSVPWSDETKTTNANSNYSSRGLTVSAHEMKNPQWRVGRGNVDDIRANDRPSTRIHNLHRQQEQIESHEEVKLEMDKQESNNTDNVNEESILGDETGIETQHDDIEQVEGEEQGQVLSGTKSNEEESTIAQSNATISSEKENDEEGQESLQSPSEEGKKKKRHYSIANLKPIFPTWKEAEGEEEEEENVVEGASEDYPNYNDDASSGVTVDADADDDFLLDAVILDDEFNQKNDFEELETGPFEGVGDFDHQSMTKPSNNDDAGKSTTKGTETHNASNPNNNKNDVLLFHNHDETAPWFTLSHYISTDSVLYDMIQGFLLSSLFCLILATIYSYTYYCCFVRCERLCCPSLGLFPDDRVEDSLLDSGKRRKRRIGISNRWGRGGRRARTSDGYRKIRSDKDGSIWYRCCCCCDWLRRCFSCLCCWCCRRCCTDGKDGYDGRGYFTPLGGNNDSDDDYSSDENGVEYSGSTLLSTSRHDDNIEDDESSLSNDSALSLEYGDEHLHDEFGEVTNRMNDDKAKDAAKTYFEKEEKESAMREDCEQRSRSERRRRSRRNRRRRQRHGDDSTTRVSRGRSRQSQTSSILSSSSEHDSDSYGSSSSSDDDDELEIEEAMMDLDVVGQKVQSSNKSSEQ